MSNQSFIIYLHYLENITNIIVLNDLCTITWKAETFLLEIKKINLFP